MAVPKRKQSKSRSRLRRRSVKAHVPATSKCPQCGASKEPHKICRACGYYRGRQVITVEAD